MPAPSSSQIRVGPRLAFTVLWTVVSVIGLGLGLLVGVPGLADLVQRGSASTTEAKTLEPRELDRKDAGADVTKGLLDFLKATRSSREQERQDLDGPLAEHRPCDANIESGVIRCRRLRAAPLDDLAGEFRRLLPEFVKSRQELGIDGQSRGFRRTLSFGDLPRPAFSCLLLRRWSRALHGSSPSVEYGTGGSYRRPLRRKNLFP